VDYSHAECRDVLGDDPREFSILTTKFVDDGKGNVAAVQTIKIDWSKPSANSPFSEVPGSQREWDADLVFLSMGFLGPESTISDMLGLQCDDRSNYKAEHGCFATSVDGVFAAGDCRRGQSLVVWAINEGRGAARAIDQYLTGHSTLPAPGVTMGSALSAWR